MPRKAGPPKNPVAMRCRQIREHFRLSQQELADALDIPMRTWQDYELGKSQPKPDALRALFHKGIDANWLISGVGSMLRAGRPDDLPAELAALGLVKLWVYDVRAGAGDGVLAALEEYAPHDYIAHRKELFEHLKVRPEDCVIVKAEGDSMEPTIRDGARMIVAVKDRELRNGKIYVFRVGDEIQVKRIYRKVNGDLELRSDNKEKYPPDTVEKSRTEGLEIIGRVLQYEGLA